MSSLNPVHSRTSANKNNRSAAPNKPNKINKPDRPSLCTFTFSDGRRCRAPRFNNHPRFCPDHARKEASARARENLAKDLAYFFSGDYLSACDLTVALGRLIPAVIRGDVKGKAARTVAYLAQTLLQSIHVSQNEYTNTFGSDAWRTSIRNSINANHDYRFPPTTQSNLNPAPISAPEPPPVVAGLQTGAVQAPQTATAPTSDQAAVANPQIGSVQPPNVPAPTSSPLPHAPSSPGCHPERSEGSQPIPATQHTPVAHFDDKGRPHTDRDLL